MFRTLALTVLILVLFAGTLPAQEAGQQNPLSQEESQEYQELQQTVGEAMGLKDYDRALPALEKQVPILEKGLGRLESGEVNIGENQEAAIGQFRNMIAVNFYNQACCLSILDRLDEANAALAKSIELGYLDVDHMKIDKDLDNIRGTEAYQKTVGGLDYNEILEFYVPENLPEGAAPLLIYLHPSSGNPVKSLDHWKSLADDLKMVLAVPAAPFTIAKDRYDWKRHSDDEEGAIKKVLSTIDIAVRDRSVDPTKVYLFGRGQGGYFANLIALANPDKIKGSLAVNAFWNKYYFEDFLSKANAGGVKVCFLHGEEDPFFEKAKSGHEQLTTAGVGAKLITYVGGRELPEDHLGLFLQGLRWLME